MPYALPPSLTVAHWRNAKGFLDHLNQHSGMNGQLAKLAQAAERVDLTVVTQASQRISDATSEEAINRLEQAIKQELDRDLQELLKEANETLRMIGEVSAKLGSSKLTTADMKKNLETMKGAAAGLVRDLMRQTQDMPAKVRARFDRRRRALMTASRLSLAEVANDQRLRSMLQSFGEKAHISESVSYYLLHTPVPQTMRDAFDRYENYIKKGAPRELNVSGQHRTMVVTLVDKIINSRNIQMQDNLETKLGDQAFATSLKLNPANAWQNWTTAWKNIHTSIEHLLNLEAMKLFRSSDAVIDYFDH